MEALKTVLYAEDDKFIFRAVILLLQEDGYEVFHGVSAEEAVGKLPAGKFVLLTDFSLIGGTGEDVLRGVAERLDPDGWGRVCAVILYSADSRGLEGDNFRTFKAAAEELGVPREKLHLLLKPEDQGALFALLKRLKEEQGNE